MDEEVESDGTNTADCPLYSKILSIRLKAQLNAATSSLLRWILYKAPDGESLVSNMVSQWHSSDDSPTQREIRKNTLAKGMIRVAADRQVAFLSPFIKRKTLARIGSLSENDKIILTIAKDAAGSAVGFDGFGQAYVRANG